MDKKGFSLVEVLIAVAILLLGILSIMMLILHAERTNLIAQQKTIAGLIARSQSSQLHAAPLEALPDWFEANSLKLLDTPDGLCRGWVTNVQAVSPEAKLFRVTLYLTMENGDVEEFVTYVAPKGVMSGEDHVFQSFESLDH